MGRALCPGLTVFENRHLSKRLKAKGQQQVRDGDTQLPGDTEGEEGFQGPKRQMTRLGMAAPLSLTCSKHRHPHPETVPLLPIAPIGSLTLDPSRKHSHGLSYPKSSLSESPSPLPHSQGESTWNVASMPAPATPVRSSVPAVTHCGPSDEQNGPLPALQAHLPVRQQRVARRGCEIG